MVHKIFAYTERTQSTCDSAAAKTYGGQPNETKRQLFASTFSRRSPCEDFSVVCRACHQPVAQRLTAIAYLNEIITAVLFPPNEIKPEGSHIDDWLAWTHFPRHGHSTRTERKRTQFHIYHW